MIGSNQVKGLIEFYTKVINKPPEMSDENWAGWQVGVTFFGVSTHSEMNGLAKEPARIMFNLETNEVKEEFERIKGLGAKVIKEPYDIDGNMICTFADPDGNFFQLMSPWKSK